MKLILIRHGQSVANANGLLAGRFDYALTAAGREQAQLAARLVAGRGPQQIISSPLGRAFDTASPIAAATELAVELAPDWIELDYGDWEGRPIVDVTAAEWARWRADSQWAPPGGESLAAVQLRVERALAQLRDSAADVAVVVSHVSPMKAAIAWALGATVESTWNVRLAPAAWVEIDLAARSLTCLASVERLA